MDGFVLQDDAADELGLTRRGKEHFAVCASALLGRRDAERIEALRQCGNRLIGGENSFPVDDQRGCDALEIVAHDSNPYLLSYLT
jgi:hypothetical protein